MSAASSSGFFLAPVGSIGRIVVGLGVEGMVEAHLGA